MHPSASFGASLVCLFALLLGSCRGGSPEERQVERQLQSLAVLSAGDALLSTSPAGKVQLGEEVFSIESCGFEFEGDVLVLVAVFEEGRSFLAVPFEGEEPSERAMLLRGESELEIPDPDYLELETEDLLGFHGLCRTADDQVLPVTAVLGISSGSSTFRLEGTRALLNGELGASTYRQVEYLIAEHPEVDTIVFEHVPGSVDDEVNVQTGRLIREAGLTTILPENGMIASGGVDLFCAGSRRVIRGGRIGVHSWADPDSGLVARDLPRDHEAHRLLLDYSREMLERGEEFYFYTLAAAPFDDVHWMSAGEVEAWGLATSD